MVATAHNALFAPLTSVLNTNLKEWVMQCWGILQLKSEINIHASIHQCIFWEQIEKKAPHAIRIFAAIRATYTQHGLELELKHGLELEAQYEVEFNMKLKTVNLPSMHTSERRQQYLLTKLLKTISKRKELWHWVRGLGEISSSKPLFHSLSSPELEEMVLLQENKEDKSELGIRN